LLFRRKHQSSAALFRLRNIDGVDEAGWLMFWQNQRPLPLIKNKVGRTFAVGRKGGTVNDRNQTAIFGNDAIGRSLGRLQGNGKC
jgi:hypothetical protein